MKRAGKALIAAAALMAGMPRPASALTADGALMTNSAFATFAGAAGYSVPYRTSYLATASVLVCNPVVAYVKTATPTAAAPTNTVTFTLCAVNSSITTSALNLVLVDRLPDNMAYVGELARWSGGGTMQASYATALTGAAWCASPCYPSVGANNTVVAPGAYYLRWVANVTGPRQSACVTYQATIL